MALRSCLTAVIAAGLLAAGPGTAVAAPDAPPAHRTSAAVAASHFDDGSFEYPTAPANSFRTVPAGDAIGPWRVVTGSVDLIGAGFWQAAEGDQSVDLNGSATGSVAQTFTTEAGTTYTVTYALAANPEGGPAVKTGRVLIDGQNFQDFSFDSTGKTRADMGYVKRQVTFVATGSTTTLSFASNVPGAYGPVIDDVTVRKSCCCSCSG